MNTSQREPEGETVLDPTFNIAIHHHDKSARYFRASGSPRHAFVAPTRVEHLTSASHRARTKQAVRADLKHRPVLPIPS